MNYINFALLLFRTRQKKPMSQYLSVSGEVRPGLGKSKRLCHHPSPSGAPHLFKIFNKGFFQEHLWKTFWLISKHGRIAFVFSVVYFSTLLIFLSVRMQSTFRTLRSSIILIMVPHLSVFF